MPTYYTQDQITEQVKRHIKKYFDGSNSAFIEYTGVNTGSFYSMLKGDLAWNDDVLNAIKFEREKRAYVRAKE